MYYTPYNAPAGFDWIVRLDGWHIEANTLHLSGRTAANTLTQLSLSALSPFVWRMVMTIPAGDQQPPTPYSH